jgi:hypothetical protein
MPKDDIKTPPAATAASEAPAAKPATLPAVVFGAPVWVQPAAGAYMLNEVGAAYPVKPSKVNATAYVLRCLNNGDLVQAAQP